jgi:hypothetical protein
VSGAGERQRAAICGIVGADMAQANVCKSPKFGYNFQVNFESRVKNAHISFGPA